MSFILVIFSSVYLRGATSMFFAVLPVQTVTDCMELFDAGSWITFGTPFLAVAILPVLRGMVLDVQMVTVCAALLGACSWITWATSPMLEVSPAIIIPALPANTASDIAVRAILLSRVVFMFFLFWLWQRFDAPPDFSGLPLPHFLLPRAGLLPSTAAVNFLLFAWGECPREPLHPTMRPARAW